MPLCLPCFLPSPMLLILVIIPALTQFLLVINCYLHRDHPDHVFEVKILKDKSVAALKDAIKEKKRPNFDHLPADSLVL